MGEGGLNLALDLKAGKQRYGFVIVVFELAEIVRHDPLDEFFRFGKSFFIVNEDLTNVVGQMIAQCADHRVAFLVDQERRGAFDRGPLDRLPDPHQVIEIPSQFLVAAADAGGADDNAHPRVDVQLAQGIADQVAVFAGDPAGHAAGARVIGHQDDEAASQADKGGQRRTLGAAFDFLDLDDDLLAFAEHILDVDA